MKRTFFYLTCILIMSLMLAGCASKSNNKEVAQPSQEYLRITDDAGKMVVLAKKPERIVVLSTSLLDLLYGVGGQAIGKPSSKTPAMFPASKNATDIGFVYNVNIEQVVALQPDLVIGFQGIHEKMIPILESSHIPVIMLKMKTYDDVLAKMKLFGDIAGTPEKAQSVMEQMQSEVQKVTAKLPAQNKKVVILHATAKNVTVELDKSIAGGIANMLALQNIAVGSKPIDGDSDIAPYSLEKLVEGDADVILVVTMGNIEEIKKRMTADISSNPAWAGLRAVKEGQIFFLPSELFQLNPGLRFPESVAYMANVVYPEVYSNAQ